MILTILAEDHKNPDYPELDSSHGFSLYAESEKIRVLYDFGTGKSLDNNSRNLGIDLAKVELAVLSHGHYDHSDGMEWFLKNNDRAVIYHGRGAFHPRWSISKGSPRDVGISLVPTDEVVKRLKAIDTLIEEESYVILPAAPGHECRPKGNAKLLSGPKGNRLQDDFTDELTLVLRAQEGLVVVTGCSHRGILNIVSQVQTYCQDCPIKALVGGFHLIDSDEPEENVRKIGEQLKQALPGTRIIAGHCTGEKSIKTLEEAIERPIERLQVGLKLNF